MTVPMEFSSEFAQKMTARHQAKVPGFTAVGGRKYDRLFALGRDGRQSSVEAFIERETGNVFKPAGLNAPARHVRANIADQEQLERVVHNSDPFGGWLYLR